MFSIAITSIQNNKSRRRGQAWYSYTHQFAGLMSAGDFLLSSFIHRDFTRRSSNLTPENAFGIIIMEECSSSIVRMLGGLAILAGAQKFGSPQFLKIEFAGDWELLDRALGRK